MERITLLYQNAVGIITFWIYPFSFFHDFMACPAYVMYTSTETCSNTVSVYCRRSFNFISTLWWLRFYAISTYLKPLDGFLSALLRPLLLAKFDPNFATYHEKLYFSTKMKLRLSRIRLKKNKSSILWIFIFLKSYQMTS